MPIFTLQVDGEEPVVGDLEFNSFDPTNLYFILHDFQLDPLPERFVKQTSAPETVKIPPDYYMRVTPELDRYMRTLIGLLNPGMSPIQFETFYHSLMEGDTAFTNFHGIESNDWAMESVICAGATVRATGREIISGMMEIRAININSLPPPPKSINDVDFTRHFRPTIFTHVKLDDGTLKVNPFPQFYGRILLPILSNTGTIWLPYKRLMPVEMIINPFNPPREP